MDDESIGLHASSIHPVTEGKYIMIIRNTNQRTTNIQFTIFE